MSDFHRVGPKDVWICKASECSIDRLQDELERHNLIAIEIPVPVRLRGEVEGAYWTYRTSADKELIFVVEYWLAKGEMWVSGFATCSRADLEMIWSILYGVGFRVPPRKTLGEHTGTLFSQFLGKS